MERKSRAIILMMLLLMLSIPTMAFRKLTTTQIRENSIRINALELDEIDNEYNMKLGMRRAESVKAKMIEFGVPASRIVGVESRGEEEPVATNDTAEGRALNRRIEFKLVRKN